MIKHKAIRLVLFTVAALLIIPALYSFLLLTMARVDTSEEFLFMRSVAYYHVIIWTIVAGIFKLSRPPKEPKEAATPTTWLAQMLGEQGAAIVENLLIILLVAGAAWFVSAGSMQGEYGRMVHPEEHQDWLYRITGI